MCPGKHAGLGSFHTKKPSVMEGFRLLPYYLGDHPAWNSIEISVWTATDQRFLGYDRHLAWATAVSEHDAITQR